MDFLLSVLVMYILVATTHIHCIHPRLISNFKLDLHAQIKIN